MNQPANGIITRRNVLGWGGGTALLTASLSGCGFFSTDPATEGGNGGGGGGDTDAKESPMLAAKVEAGELEPLEERIPAEPLVVSAAEAGVYGGTWRTVTTGPGDGAAFWRVTGYQPPLRMDPMLEEIQPNLCTDIETSDDGKAFTLHIREGIRWSDGEPFGADDIVFAIEDVWGNTDINPAPPSYLSHDGELVTVKKDDDHTVTISFPEPNGTFRDTSAQSMDLVRFPKHYVSQFLPKYNDAIKKEAKDEGFDAWTDYFEDRAGWDARWSNPDFPVLDPWVTVEPLGEGNRVKLERNPYFWKTDSDGRQLPYIDELSYEVVMDPQVMVLKGSDGELDMIYRHVNNPANKPVFAESREGSQYGLVDLKATSMNTMCFALNLAHQDKAKRELYQNKDFRIGISHAINREELITAVWQRQGEPWQAAPTKDSQFFDEEFAKQYTEFDVDLANEHLDKVVPEKNNKGLRLMQNGKPVIITLDVPTAMFEEWPAAADIISTMLEKVGVQLKVNPIDRTLFYERKTWEANQHDAGIWGGDGGLAVEMMDPRWYMPFSDESVWATPWAEWFNSQGSSGTEPIKPVKDQFELFWELRRTPEEAGRVELFQQVLDIAKEEFFVIGIGTAPNPYMLVKNRLKNVMGDIPDTWVYYTPGHGNPEAWFIDGES